ncbi:MAG: EAL domain-containing protein, partial [Chloroflexota bacterium]
IPNDALLSLNVSPRSFEAPEFSAASFLGILQRHGVKPNRVLMELTEREAVQDPERLRAAIETVQAAGVRVAADDVGAGNAGLRLLSQFRFDVVKIDLSLVQGGAKADQTMSVLTSLVQLAARWGALTIAEGVETAAQLRMIRQLDVDAGQGYLLGRPGVIADVTTIDLEALAGALPVGESPAGVAWPVRASVPIAVAGTAAPREPVAVGARPRRASDEPLSAHAIIANGAPSSFGPRGSP